MTKMNYKIISLSFSLVCFSFFPLQKTFGVMSGPKGGNMVDRQGEAQSKRQENICERIVERAENFENRLSNLSEEIKSRKKARLQNWEERKDDRDAKLSQFRTRRDVNLEEHFKMLEERAGTDEQKQAVLEFEKRVRAAVERREAIDGAISTFRDGVDAAVSGRKDDLSAAADKFEAAQTAAFEKAKSDCASGTDAKTVRTTLRNSLKNAKANLGTDRQNAEKIRTQMEALIQTRKNAVEKAIADFKAEMEAAKAELKKAFPEA